MPKYRALTKNQREQQELDRVHSELLESILAPRETLEQAADRAGVCRNTLAKWRGGKIGDATLDRVIRAAWRRGYRIKIEKVGKGKSEFDAMLELLERRNSDVHSQMV